jgi:hypothetical protein
MIDKDELLKKVVPITALESSNQEKALQKFKDDYKKAYSGKKEKASKEPEQLKLTGFPTDLCRSTIFFPLPRKGRKNLQSEPVIIPFQTKWSYGEYEGRRLSVDDEDLLLVLLYLSKENEAKEFITTYPEIQRLMGMKPNSKYNAQIRDAFQRFGKASFTVNFRDADNQWSVDHILRAKGYKRKIQISIGEDFYNEFMNGYTLMSLPFRMRIKGDISKLLFTFLSSHRNPATYTTDTLVKALNMNKNRQKKFLRSQLKMAFSELEAKGFLIRHSFNKNRDTFQLETIPPKKRRRLK